MRQLFVIGDPVGHSLSPMIHRAMIAQTGTDWAYDVRPVTPDELADFVRWARDGGCGGFNVTMPHKEAILPLLDEVDGAAAACGAVNTVCIRQGCAVGHNTDGTGFLDSLAAHGFDPKGRQVLLLGAGGAAKAVCHALAQAGAAQIFIAARHREHAAALAAQVQAQVVAFGGAEMAQAAERCALIVNATPLGMEGSPAFGNLHFLEGAARGTVVYDLVYHPRRTALLTEAAGLGLPVVGGIDLLLRQAIRAFTFFTGLEPDAAALYETLRQPLGLE